MRITNAAKDLVGLLFVIHMGGRVSVLQHLEEFSLFLVHDQSLFESGFKRSFGRRNLNPFVFRQIDSQRFPAKFKGEFKALKHGIGLNRRCGFRHCFGETPDGLGEFRECEVNLVVRR